MLLGFWGLDGGVVVFGVVGVAVVVGVALLQVDDDDNIVVLVVVVDDGCCDIAGYTAYPRRTCSGGRITPTTTNVAVVNRGRCNACRGFVTH